MLPGCTENGDRTKRKKDQTENTATLSPGKVCANERQDSEQKKVARFGVHFSNHADRRALGNQSNQQQFPFSKGQQSGCPLRESMALNRTILGVPGSGRQAIFLGATEPRAARPGKDRRRGDASRPSLSDGCQRPQFLRLARHCGAGKILFPGLNTATVTSPVRRSFRATSLFVFHHACRLGLGGIVSKRKGSPYRSGRRGR